MTSAVVSNMSDSLVLFSSDDEESDSHYESKQYENFTSMLKGVPPPSSITVSKFTVEEMLQKYKENEASFGFGLESGSANLSSSKNPVPFLKYSNSSQISENIASIALKVQERYVQMETMSSCNIWLRATLETCGSAKKRLRMRQNVGLSPGRRLSHLARRRQFFSSANLQRLASTENIRQIEIRKNSNVGYGRKKMTRTVESEKLKSSKRALFLSPENGTPTKYGSTMAVERKIYSSGSDERKRLPLQERSKKVEVLRWLSQQNFEMDFPRKRLRDECANHSVERKRKCPRRSLNFADDDASSNVATSESNNSADKKTSSSGKLSEIHKNKLLWAISVVLRENNITRTNENFKSLAAKLFFTCRTNLDEILSMNTGEGTSDKILYFARKIIPSVFEELGIKLSPENNFKSEKNGTNSESLINHDSREESKENINKNNIDNEHKSSNCHGGELEFVFKTPRKVRPKRIVKSCQKTLISGNNRKMNVMRRWRSLELLIEDAVLSTMTDLKNGVNVGQEKRLKDENNFNGSENAQSTPLNGRVSKYNDPNSSDFIENEDAFCCPKSVTPSLPFVDTSVAFSPIPSSVKEESYNILYPSLRKQKINVEESELPSDENSFSQGTNESMELLNQDTDLEKILQKGSVFTQEYLMRYGETNTTEKETIPDVESPQIVDQTESCQASGANTNIHLMPAASNPQCSELKTEESFILTGNPPSNDYKIKEDMIGKENKEEKVQYNAKSDAVGNNELWEPLTPECITKVEKGTYKPRKLVVKKSKPNWKVVRQNSDEAENESELRLKMRLSHEWEIVCRNSSCSDIGNNSEYETTSANCSRRCSTTDKDISTDNEAEDSWRRNSIQSKCDESMDEGLTKFKVLSEKNVKQIGEPDPNFNSNSRNYEIDLSKYDQTMQKTLTQGVCQSSITILSDEVHNSLCWEKSCDITVADDSLSDKSNTGESDHETGLTVPGEGGDSESEDEIVNSNNFNASINSTNSNMEHISENQGWTSSGGKITFENSQSPVSKRDSEEKSSEKGNSEKKINISPETRAKDEDCTLSKRSRESERVHYDSESGNSSPSNGPERKKRLLSLENYKARKLEEASNSTKLKISNEETESKDFSSVEKGSGNNTTKKIYNIRLKHPLGHHKTRRKHKHKKYAKEKRVKHKSRERDSEDLEFPDGSNSGLHLHSLHKFLDSFCGKNPSEKVHLTDVNRSLQNGHTANRSTSNCEEVNIQTIIDALSALSNLVQEQIKIESDTMTAHKESGDLKKNNWLDVVSSWCGKNLNYFKLMSSASSRSGFQGKDDGNRAAVNKVLSVSQPSDLDNADSNNTEHSVINHNGIVNNTDPIVINPLKTELNLIQECVGSASEQTNLTDTTLCDNAALVNTNVNLSQNSVICNSIRLSNDPQTINFQNYSLYSNSQCIGSQSNLNSFNYSVPFSGFSGMQSVAAADLKLSRENIGLTNTEGIIPVGNRQNTPKTALKDPRCNPDSSSKRQRDADGSRSSDYNETLTSAFPSNGGEYQSIQTPYQFPNNFITTQKPFYQPNIYSNYQNWQGHSDMSSWNYHQNAMPEGYQNSSFYPFHMSNVPYYINKY